MINKTLEALTKLERGKKYTIFFYSEFGFPSALQITLDDIKVESYAQFDETVLLIFVQKGKRKLSGKRFYGQSWDKFLVYDGHVTLENDIFINGNRSELSCSDVYIQRAMTSTTQKPLIAELGVA